MKLALTLCLSLALLPSCAGDKALIVSGESLVTLADQFVGTAAAMDAALDSGAITPETYKAWAAFGRKFQAAYPLATNLWRVAADTKDEKLRTQVVAVVAQLAADLAGYAALVGVRL